MVTSRTVRDWQADAARCYLVQGISEIERAQHLLKADKYNQIAAAMEEQEALIERLETGIRDLLRENQRRADDIQQQNQTIIALIGERITKGTV